MGPAVSGFAEVGPALHGLRNVWSTMSAAGAGRPAKRARLGADKCRDALAEGEDKYADIDFTRFQKVTNACARSVMREARQSKCYKQYVNAKHVLARAVVAAHVV